MTNTQLYITTGVPIFAVLLVWLGSTLANKHNSGLMRGSLDDVRRSIDALGTSLRAEMRTGFDAVEQRLTRLETTVDLINKEIRVDHEHRLTVLEQRMLTKIG